jgi:hypothetical protein
MTMRCGGMLRSITMAAHPIATAVTLMVIAGQLCCRKYRAGMQHFSLCRHRYVLRTGCSLCTNALSH